LFPGRATDFFARRTLPKFNPAAARYDAGNAIWLAELCRLVYRHDVEEDNPPPQPTRTDFLARAGLRQLGFFNSPQTDTQALLVQSEGAPAFAALVFRGTEQKIKDWKRDLVVGNLVLSHRRVDVHDGFDEGLSSVWPQIAAELAKLTCPVFYTGHSLGAGLATLAAARRAPTALYTFGSSRVGNQAFVDKLKAVPVYRVIDDIDFVQSIPPETLGYRHVGEEQRLRQTAGGFSFNPVNLLRRVFAPPKILADHAPVNYVDRIVL
jgi:hypothetical protein